MLNNFIINWFILFFCFFFTELHSFIKFLFPIQNECDLWQKVSNAIIWEKKKWMAKTSMNELIELKIFLILILHNVSLIWSFLCHHSKKCLKDSMGSKIEFSERGFHCFNCVAKKIPRIALILVHYLTIIVLESLFVMLHWQSKEFEVFCYLTPEICEKF